MKGMVLEFLVLKGGIVQGQIVNGCVGQCRVFKSGEFQY